MQRPKRPLHRISVASRRGCRGRSIPTPADLAAAIDHPRTAEGLRNEGRRALNATDCVARQQIRLRLSFRHRRSSVVRLPGPTCSATIGGK